MKQEYTNTTHISMQYLMKLKLKLLQNKCHVLEFTKGEAPKDASNDKSEFCEKRSSLTIGTHSLP
jgi:hypothetical protein